MTYSPRSVSSLLISLSPWKTPPVPRVHLTVLSLANNAAPAAELRAFSMTFRYWPVSKWTVLVSLLKEMCPSPALNSVVRLVGKGRRAGNALRPGAGTGADDEAAAG